VIFGTGRQPLVTCVEGRSLGHCPGREHTVDLEPEVEVQARKVVALNDKSRLTGVRPVEFWGPTRSFRPPRCAVIGQAAVAASIRHDAELPRCGAGKTVDAVILRSPAGFGRPVRGVGQNDACAPL
jgi:hypothetical protein